MLTKRYNTPVNPKNESVGRPVPGMRIKILDEAGDELQLGKIGEIITKGSHVMAGYLNDSEATKQTIQNGWLHTGDLGYMYEEGFTFIVDRLKDMIITGGENVYSTKVENAIHRHPGVGSCAVIGIPQEKWGEAVHAIVVPQNGVNLTEDEINTQCHEYIADNKCPVSVEIRLEPLPLSGPGKF